MLCIVPLSLGMGAIEIPPGHVLEALAQGWAGHQGTLLDTAAAAARDGTAVVGILHDLNLASA